MSDTTDKNDDLGEDAKTRVHQIVQDWTAFAKNNLQDAALKATDALIERLEEFKSNLQTEEAPGEETPPAEEGVVGASEEPSGGLGPQATTGQKAKGQTGQKKPQAS